MKLSYTVPDKRVDGTPLEKGDLSVVHIYYGTDPNNLNIRSTAEDSPTPGTAGTHIISDLEPNVYYFTF